MKTVSILMAVYNESRYVLPVLEKIQKVKIELEKEIIIIDGCSSDGTRDILRKLDDSNIKVIFEEKKRGKGYALRTGFLNATGDIILIQDADLELEPSYYPFLLGPILKGKTNIVYGSRFKHGRGKTNIITYLGNRLMTMTANILFNQRLTDIETCYKVFKKGLLDGLKFSCSGFDFDAELTASFLKKGHRILEVPISYEPRDKKAGKKLHWLSGITSLGALIKGRFFA